MNEPTAPSIPHNRESEEAVIGAVLINPEIYYECSRIIKHEDFYIHRNQWMWQAFESLIAERVQIDLLTVTDWLERNNKLADIGGPAYMTALINATPSSYNAVNYAEIVKDNSNRRKGINLANNIASAAYNNNESFDLSKQAVKIAESVDGNSQRVTSEGAALEAIEIINNPNCFTTSVQALDKKMGGWFPKELSIIAGYQGTGKSAIKIQEARRNAEAGKRVVLAEAEMSGGQVWIRMACGDLGIDVNQVRSNQVSDDNKQAVINKAAELARRYKDNIIIYQSPITPTDILAAAILERPDIIFVDTLYYLSGKPNQASLRDWYEDTLKFLRQNIAKAMNIHVQVLHHVNRAASAGNRPPTIHDLMFSGESVADDIILLYRKEEDYNVTGSKPKTVVPVDWIIGKRRFGWTGTESLQFNLVKQYFGATELHRQENYSYKENE